MKIIIRILFIVLIVALALIARVAFDIHKYKNDYVLPKVEMHDIEALGRFSGGLKIKTVSNPDYKNTDFAEFEKFIKYIEENYSSVFKKYEPVRVNKYNLVFKIKGKNPSLLPVLLTAHYDVVGTKNENNWKHPPYSGYFDENYIYSRGTIDDKGAVFAILEALRSLSREENFMPERDVYIAFSHCEETGSSEGAVSIIEYFKKNKIRFQMTVDEGGRLVDKNGKYFALIGTAEKGRLLSKITVFGTGAHASMPPENPPVLKLARLIEAFHNDKNDAYMSQEMLEYYLKTYSSYSLRLKFLLSNRLFLRPLLFSELSKYPEDNARIYSTHAVTVIDASKTANAISSDASMLVDTRILPEVSVQETKRKIEKIVYSILDKNEVKIEYLSEMQPSFAQGMNSDGYKILSNIIRKMYRDITIVPYLTLGATDARDYAEISTDALRFLPCVLKPEEAALMHADNEKISIRNWGRMIEFYREFIKGM